MVTALALAVAHCGTAKKSVPTVSSFTANPPTVPVGGSSTLSWTADNFATCTLKSTQPPDFDVPAKVPSGSKVVTLGQISTVFVLTCTPAPATQGGATPASITTVAYVAVQAQ